MRLFLYLIVAATQQKIECRLMTENTTNSLSLGWRVLSLGIFVPLALAGCGSAGTGTGLGGNASFGLANEGGAYIPSKSIAYRSTVTRAVPVVKLAKKKLAKKAVVSKNVRAAKLQKRLPANGHMVTGKPVSSGKIESRMAMIATNGSARQKPPAVKIKKPVAARKIVWKKKVAKHVSVRGVSARVGQPVKNSPPEKLVQMVPEKAISAQNGLADIEKSLDALSKEAARDAEITQKEQIKRTAKVAPAPITFGFGQTAHRFSSQQ